MVGREAAQRAMAATAIFPLLRRLRGEGKKGKKLSLTDEQAEDALSVLATLSLNADILGVLSGNGGLDVLGAFLLDKKNRKNVSALAACFTVCARMVAATPDLSHTAKRLRLLDNASSVVSMEHKRADLPMKRGALAFLLAMASYPEHREAVALSGAIRSAVHLLYAGGKLARKEQRGRRKKSMEDSLRESAFVRRKSVVITKGAENADPLIPNSEAEQLCLCLLWCVASSPSNRLMIVRVQGVAPVCEILKREVKQRDVLQRLQEADRKNVKRGFDESSFKKADRIAVKHSRYSSAECAAGVLWNLLADSIAQTAVMEERGPYFLALAAEGPIDEPAPSRLAMARRWGQPEACGFHLVLLFPGQDPLQEKREREEEERAKAERERQRLAKKEATGLSDDSDADSGEEKEASREFEAAKAEAEASKNRRAGDYSREEEEYGSEFEEDEEGDWVDEDDEEEDYVDEMEEKKAEQIEGTK